MAQSFSYARFFIALCFRQLSVLPIEGASYNEKAALFLTMRNVMTDLRLFLSAYMVKYLGQQKNVNLLTVIKRLLSPSLVAPTGAYNT
ncbi:hypothetical protein ACSJAZ_004493, partial [Escherichia coli]